MLSLVDVVVTFGSLIVVVFAVLRAAGRKASGTEYFLAGRDLLWPFIGMSLFASNISAEHVIGMAGDGYRIGQVAGGFEWTGAWDLLQNIAAYLSVPMAAAIFTGLLWKRGTTKGAVAAVVVGFAAGLVCFLDQALHWSLPMLSHPYLHSFLHRSLLVWILSAKVMIGVSLVTKPPARDTLGGSVFSRSRHPWTGLRDYRTWAALLFLGTVVLWWSFR